MLRNAAFGLRLRSFRSLRARHRQLAAAELHELGQTLAERYFNANERYLSSTEGQKDFFDHLVDRLADNRRRMIPWLNSIRRLDGMRVLEIGAGTGSSAVAFGEQGAELTGVDIDHPSLEIARHRCSLYQLDRVQFEHANILDEHALFQRKYDLIIFFASLEHMLFEERIEGLRKTWKMLDSGGLLAVVECPNRLWFYDGHTALLPYFHWLPDEVALSYVAASPRPSLREDANVMNMTSFLRRGRGVSYHDFELALGDLGQLPVAGELASFLQRTYPAFYLRQQVSLARSYERLLHRISPRVHRGFLRPVLDIVFRKP